MHDQAHHLRRPSDNSAIIQEDLSPPKNRFTQSWAKHRDSSIISIYSRPIASLSTVQIKSRLLFSDSSKRRFLLDAALRASFLCFPSLVKANVCFVILFASDLLCVSHCRDPGSSSQISLLTLQRPSPPSHQISSCLIILLSAPPFLPDPLHSSLCSVSLSLSYIMADQPDQQNPQEPTINIDKLFSKDCTM